MNVETEIIEMHKILARMEGKFDALSNVPQRISNLEQWQSWLKGCAVKRKTTKTPKQ
jgi:hypothetical protein